MSEHLHAGLYNQMSAQNRYIAPDSWNLCERKSPRSNSIPASASDAETSRNRREPTHAVPSIWAATPTAANHSFVVEARIEVVLCRRPSREPNQIHGPRLDIMACATTAGQRPGILIPKNAAAPRRPESVTELGVGPVFGAAIWAQRILVQEPCAPDPACTRVSKDIWKSNKRKRREK